MREPILPGAVAVAAIGSFLAVHHTVWVARVSGNVVPVEQPDPATTAYDYDLLTRRSISPTYAAVIGNRRFQSETADLLELDQAERRSVHVRVEPSPTTALITVSAWGTRRDVVDEMAEAVFDRGTLYIGTLGLRFVVDPVRYDLERRTAPLPLVVFAGLVVACAAVGWTYRRGVIRRPAPGGHGR
jgi:hypothetical protein